MPRIHTDRLYEGELQKIREMLLMMGAKVEEMLSHAMRALVERDTELAERTLYINRQINRLEMEVDDLCLRVLARRHPVASDLRFVTMALKVVTNLERMGDLGVNICERVMELNEEPPLKPYVEIVNMAEAAQEMLREALDAFVAGDAERAQAIVQRDSKVDAYYTAIFRELLTYMMENPRNIFRATRVQSIAKYIERIADHATNLAEMVVFMVRGKDIRHVGKLERRTLTSKPPAGLKAAPAEESDASLRDVVSSRARRELGAREALQSRSVIWMTALEPLPACVSCVAPSSGWTMPLGAVDDEDEEGARVDATLPFTVDAHVHLFPAPLFEAIWRWFDRYGWPIRYKLQTPEILSFVLSRGIGHIVALHYSHKPGLARSMNAFMADVVRDNPRVTGLATVMPGEPDAPKILEEAFALGLSGVKLHCHVQCFAPDAPELAELYETCIASDMPLVIHAGREPKSDGYRCDPHALCHADRIEAVLRSYPKLRLAVPHLGADEIPAYGRLLERHDNLWLDTTMTLAGYFPEDPMLFQLLEARPERIMYGTDFPNIPYAWDRELRRLGARRLPDVKLASLLGDTARGFYRLPAH